MIAIGGLGLILFVWLAYLVSSGAAGGFDSRVRQAVHSCVSPLITRIMTGATLLGESLFLVPFAAFCCWRMASGGHRRDALLCVPSMFDSSKVKVLFTT